MEAGKFITRNPDEENTSLSILLISLSDSNDTEVREAQFANEPLLNRVTTLDTVICPSFITPPLQDIFHIDALLHPKNSTLLPNLKPAKLLPCSK